MTFEEWYRAKVTPIFGDNCHFMETDLRECWQASRKEALRHAAEVCQKQRANHEAVIRETSGLVGVEAKGAAWAAELCAQALTREAEGKP